MTALYLMAFLLIAATWIAILGTGAAIGWAIYQFARWVRRRWSTQ